MLVGRKSVMHIERLVVMLRRTEKAVLARTRVSFRPAMDLTSLNLAPVRFQGGGRESPRMGDLSEIEMAGDKDKMDQGRGRRPE